MEVLSMKTATSRIAILASITMLGACADVPTRDNLGYAWTTTTSACRAGGKPNDKRVAQDLNRCKAFVDYTNPGRSEAAYTGLINGIATLIGTAITYNIVLYRGAVEACMFSLGRDPKLTEQYFGLVKYSGKVQEFTEVAKKLTAKP